MNMIASKAPTGEALAKLRAKAQQEIRALLRERVGRLDDDSIDLILRTARSHYAWQDKPVERELLETIYDITAAGATSMNSCPARFVSSSKHRKPRNGWPSR